MKSTADIQLFVLQGEGSRVKSKVRVSSKVRELTERVKSPIAGIAFFLCRILARLHFFYATFLTNKLRYIVESNVEQTDMQTTVDIQQNAKRAASSCVRSKTVEASHCS